MGLSLWNVTPKPPQHRHSPGFEGDTKGSGVVGWVGLGLAIEIRTPSRGKWQPRCASG